MFKIDKMKILTKVLTLKEYLKTSKSVFEKDLDTFTFYNKNNLKDYKVLLGRIIDNSYIEFSLHLPKEVDLSKDLFFMDKEGKSYVIDKESIRTTYKEVTLHSKVDQHPGTTCKYKKIKLLIQD